MNYYIHPLISIDSEYRNNQPTIQVKHFHHDLTLQFGLLASECKNDDDYLEQANRLIAEWKSDLSENR